MLDEAGFPEAKICASGDLDERSISSLMQQGAKIDIWGVGTKLITSEDLPALGGVYKMSALFQKDGRVTPKIKMSDNSEKVTTPGFKSLYRMYDRNSGMAIADLITLADEQIDESKPITIFHPIDTWKKKEVHDFKLEKLQHTIVKGGKLVYKFPKLTEIREFSKAELSKFWEEYLRLDMPQVYKVDLSEKLHTLKTDMINAIREGKIKE
ncbi:MAG: nicotinate phosphoribosyltransferase, partial [Clostridia bacterium]|nr:nicotinate phosphoribosyltransferase [Clostridia bacterium]